MCSLSRILWAGGSRLPEGKPFFELKVIEFLRRNGIDEGDATEDFNAGLDSDMANGLRFKYGHLGVYAYQERIIMGRMDLVVVAAWLRDAGEEG